MDLEQRIRAAMDADVGRLELPPRPALDELSLRRRSSRRVVLAAVAAVVGAVVIFAVAGQSGVSIPQIDPLQPATPDESTAPDRAVSFDLDDGDVFATGEGEGLRWIGAVRREELTCVGIRLHGPGVDESSSSCGEHGLALISSVTVRSGETLAVVGLVAPGVERLVWDHPDGPIEVPVDEHVGIDERVFAIAAPLPRTTTLIEAYDADGQRLGAAGVSGTATPGDQ